MNERKKFVIFLNIQKKIPRNFFMTMHICINTTQTFDIVRHTTTNTN